jgi:hypothetical protein
MLPGCQLHSGRVSCVIWAGGRVRSRAHVRVAVDLSRGGEARVNSGTNQRAQCERETRPAPLEDLDGKQVEHGVHDAAEAALETELGDRIDVVDANAFDVLHRDDAVGAELGVDERDVDVILERGRALQLLDRLARILGWRRARRRLALIAGESLLRERTLDVEVGLATHLLRDVCKDGRGGGQDRGATLSERPTLGQDEQLATLRTDIEGAEASAGGHLAGDSGGRGAYK